MKTSTVAWVIAIIVVIAGVGWYVYANSGAGAALNTQTTTQNPNTNVTPSTAAKTVTVLYGPNGFSPSTITINAGDTVTFTNNGGDEMWVASDPHPTHEGYDGTTLAQHCAAGYTGPVPFDQCAAGTTYSFMFTKVGTWGYHNHGNHTDTGTIIVQ